MTLKNTDKEYKIVVRNTQTIDGEQNVIEETALGSYREKNGKQYITYRTEETKESESAASTLILDGDSLTIRRHGNTSSRMVYKAGHMYSFPYATPYGTIDMKLETDRLISYLSEHGGTIELAYTLTIQGEKYLNEMKITVVKG